MEQEVRIKDPESVEYGKKESFEQVVLRQMQRCVDNLSKEVTAGHFKEKKTKTGTVQEWQEDVRHLIINSVQTLLDLMLHYLEGDYEEHIEAVIQEVENFRKELNDRVITMRGRGQVKVGSLKVIPKETIIYQEFLEYKVEKFREIFAILTLVYNKFKAQMAEDEIEYIVPDEED